MINDSRGRAIQRGRLVGSPIVLALTVASARSVALSPRTAYRLWCSVDAFVKFGDGTVVAAATDHPLTAKTELVVTTDNANVYLAAIVATGTGTLFISEMDMGRV